MSRASRPVVHGVPHVAFCIDNSFAPYAAVALRSLHQAHPEKEVFVHILTPGLTRRNTLRLEEAAGGAASLTHLHLHQTDGKRLIGLENGSYTRHAWLRLLLPETLRDVARVLYLDADTLVADDLSSLFSLDMGNKSVASVRDGESFHAWTLRRLGCGEGEGYFCSGVMLMDLDAWRKRNLTERVIAWAREHGPSLRYPDQDALNAVLHGDWLPLPLRYNVTRPMLLCGDFWKEPFREELRESVFNPAIIHYAGTAPWIKERAVHPMQQLWEDTTGSLSFRPERRYESRRTLRLKLWLWDKTHAHGARIRPTLEEIQTRLEREAKPPVETRRELTENVTSQKD